MKLEPESKKELGRIAGGTAICTARSGSESPRPANAGGLMAAAETGTPVNDTSRAMSASTAMIRFIKCLLFLVRIFTNVRDG